MSGAIRRILRGGAWLLVAVALALGAASDAHADARSSFLIRILTSSTQFRVRAQAALALGSQASDPAVVRALMDALHDEHPAVRAAGAAALERLGDPTAVPALKMAQNDRDGSVRTAVRSALASLDRTAEPTRTAPVEPLVPEPTPGSASFYVGIGVPGSQAAMSSEALRELRAHLAREVAQISGVVVAPENEESKAAERVLATQKLVGYFIDSSIVSVEVRADGAVRAQVSVVVGTYPGRDIRAMLQGAATLMGGGSDEAAKLQAVQAAYTSALRRLPQAMQAGLARAP